MALLSYDDFIEIISNDIKRSSTIQGTQNTVAVNSVAGDAAWTLHRAADTKDVPNPLETGVTSYIPTMFSLGSTVANTVLMVTRLIDLGSLNIATPTFTDGSNMGTSTVMGATLNNYSAVICEVTTALNATPGSITVTYVDQSGNTAETSTSRALGASAPIGSAGFLQLNANDWGVRDITTATRTGGTSPTGVIQFWGMETIGLVSIHGSGTMTDQRIIDLMNNGFNLVKLPAGAKIGIFSFGSLAVKRVLGMGVFVGDN